MPSLNETFTNHPVCKLYKSMRKDIVLEHFSSWINETTYNDWHLSLYKFAEIRPLTYFDPKIIETLLDFFEANHEVVFDALYALQGKITHAFASILRQGNSWDNENSLSVDNPKGIKDFESVWHPEYQRYCEHIFNHLIRIPLYILGNLHNKNYLRVV